MMFIEKLFDFLIPHRAVIVNSNEDELKEQVRALKQHYGPWSRIIGFTNYPQMFMAIHLAKFKKRPFKTAFFHKEGCDAAPVILNQVAPNVKTFRFSDTPTLLHLAQPLVR